jgi:two-component system response regulator DctR
MAVEALRAGAVEFLEKPFSAQTLIERIQAAMGADRYRRYAAARFAAFTERVVRLTQREREVLGLLVEGRPNKAIARALALSCKTVETHRAKLMHKTGVESLAELIRFGLQLQGGPDPERAAAAANE